VFSGGLSSYSIMLMVIAHLQSEGLRAAHAVALAAAEGAGDAQDADRLLTGLRAALRPAAAAESAPSHADLGPLLCSFFDRFGKRFRCCLTNSVQGYRVKHWRPQTRVYVCRRCAGSALLYTAS